MSMQKSWQHIHSDTLISCPGLLCEVSVAPCGFDPDDEVVLQTDQKEWDVFVFNTHTYIFKKCEVDIYLNDKKKKKF